MKARKTNPPLGKYRSERRLRQDLPTDIKTRGQKCAEAQDMGAVSKYPPRDVTNYKEKNSDSPWRKPPSSSGRAKVRRDETGGFHGPEVMHRESATASGGSRLNLITENAGQTKGRDIPPQNT